MLPLLCDDNNRTTCVGFIVILKFSADHMLPVVGTIADLSLFPALCNQHADSVCSRREVDPRRYCGKQVEGEAAKGRRAT